MNPDDLIYIIGKQSVELEYLRRKVAELEKAVLEAQAEIRKATDPVPEA